MTFTDIYKETDNQTIPADEWVEMLDEYSYERPKKGDVLEGEILKIRGDILYLDVGAKRDAVVPYDEVNELEDSLLADLAPGDTVPVYVYRTPVGDEDLVVSLKRGLAQQDWLDAQTCLDNDETLELEVISHNKGGVLVQFRRIEGFVPNSHIPDIRSAGSSSQRQAHKARLVGQRLKLKPLEVVPQRRRFVLSEAAAEKETRQLRLIELKQMEGQTITGTVKNLASFGAFVDLDGIDGLIHVSKLAWEKIDHPASVLEVGDSVEVLIERVDIERERITLNRKKLLTNPWEKVAEQHEIGDLVAGHVTNIVDFGLFVRLPIGVDGLVHTSEIDIPEYNNVEDVLKLEDRVLARIMDIKPEQQRLSLSLRRVTLEEEVNWMQNNVTG